MVPGAFWGIALESGRYGCGLVLDIKAGSRTQFIAGLTDWTGQAPPSTIDLSGAKCIAQGEAHLKTITAKNSLILGVIDLKAHNIYLELCRDSGDFAHGYVVQGYRTVRQVTKDDCNLPVFSTWGYSVISIRANSLDESRR